MVGGRVTDAGFVSGLSSDKGQQAQDCVSLVCGMLQMNESTLVGQCTPSRTTQIGVLQGLPHSIPFHVQGREAKDLL